MRTLKMMLVLATVTMVAVSCGPKKPKVLVLYYSQTSNTKAVAQEIATKMGADMEEIIPVKPYDGDFNATINRCMEEREHNVVTEIQPIKAKIKKYDIIFIGYPVWFGTYAPPIATFLDQVDLSEKTVVPFCTFGSGGLVSSIRDLCKKQPNAKIHAGYGVRAARLAAMPNEVDQFLKENQFIEGEPILLGEFSDLEPVTEAEAAIFDAAVGDYPMMHAKAEYAGSRDIPGGKEYLFLAVDLPREDNPDMPPAGEMKVYVNVLDGQQPEFTQVVRQM
ncbi:MAG: NAD(P)H-dependent oxidoreductase [Bacteroidales bacterium]|nr:NAD(P)H-dependent oxidoreductase [Bacteroidales bacterium]